MALHRSLDESKIIAALLHDVHIRHGAVFNYSSLRHTLKKVQRRLSSEGLGFLTKTLPKLGKAFDKALSECTPLNSSELRFSSLPGSKLPRFLGELFSRVLDQSGLPLREPCTISVEVIRQVCYLFYKYELPYTDELEQQVLDKFERTEQELLTVNSKLDELQHIIENAHFTYRRRSKNPTSQVEVAREARILLSRLFASFDPKDIYPRHGPGAVATKQKLWDKYQWTNISAKITSVYPLDAFFYASLGHFCDRLKDVSSLSEADLPAKVILVPKDSRGPRLISCEPVDYQWVQQGLGKAIVSLVETSALTRHNVFFTNQQPNRFGALLGSSTGRYATLDLNEASDRVSVGLVRLLFPEHVYTCLMACRSSSTVLPTGKVLNLNKFAPMGSCLCFPIMALTIWAILTAAAPDQDTRESILVYGDDVIVPTAYAANAMEQLESFGLKINRDKSCISGLFRESCGMDAFKGYDVTPVRLRTVWSSSRSPESYSSWVAYANSFYFKKYFSVYDYIVEELSLLYGSIPTKDMVYESCPSLPEEPPNQRPIRTRINKRLQRREFYVWCVKAVTADQEIDGWSMLLRYFCEANDPSVRFSLGMFQGDLQISEGSPWKGVGSYTHRRASMLVRKWR